MDDIVYVFLLPWMMQQSSFHVSALCSSFDHSTFEHWRKLLLRYPHQSCTLEVVVVVPHPHPRSRSHRLLHPQIPRHWYQIHYRWCSYK